MLFVNLYRKTLDPTKSWGVPEGIDMSTGIQSAINYFSRSRNPYDIAMRGLHDTYQDMTVLKEQGAYGKGFSPQDQIIEFIENGYTAVKGATDGEKHNRIFKYSFKESILEMRLDS